MTRASRGFTLVEVLVAMLIIGLTTPLLMGAVIGSLTRTRESQGRSSATVWVQGEIEYLRRLCYAGLLTGIGTTYPRKVTGSAQPGEPLLPTVLEGRYSLAPDAGYVQVASIGPALLRVSVSYYESDWGAALVPPGPGELSAATYVAQLFSGRCPP